MRILKRVAAALLIAAFSAMPALADWTPKKSGGSPGGTNGQIQYNNSGTFGGVTAVPVANGGTGTASGGITPTTNNGAALGTPTKVYSDTYASRYWINGAIGVQSGTVTTGTSGFRCGVTPDGSRLYAPNYGDGTVSVIRTSDNTVVATVTVGANPIGATVTPDGLHVYVGNSGASTVSVIQTSDNTVSATITVGAGPYSVGITPNGTKGYVNNYTDGTVSVIRLSDNTVTSTVTVGTNPWGQPQITPDGAHVYVPCEGSNNVKVIQTSDDTVSATIAGMTVCHSLTITPDGTKVYVVNSTASTLQVVRTSDNTVIATLSTGLTTNDLFASAMAPDGQHVYTIGLDGNLCVFDITTGRLIQTKATGAVSNVYGLTVGAGSVIGNIYVMDTSGSTIRIFPMQDLATPL